MLETGEKMKTINCDAKNNFQKLLIIKLCTATITSFNRAGFTAETEMHSADVLVLRRRWRAFYHHRVQSPNFNTFRRLKRFQSAGAKE